MAGLKFPTVRHFFTISEMFFCIVDLTTHLSWSRKPSVILLVTLAFRRLSCNSVVIIGFLVPTTGAEILGIFSLNRGR